MGKEKSVPKKVNFRQTGHKNIDVPYREPRENGKL